MKGQLFTQFLLSDDIRTTPEWGATATQLADYRHDLADMYTVRVAARAE